MSIDNMSLKRARFDREDGNMQSEYEESTKRQCLTPETENLMNEDEELSKRRPSGPQLTSRLLTLPDELKYRIYSSLLDDRVSLPRGPRLGDHQNCRGDIKYPKHYRSWRWPPLVWTSTQSRNELMDHAGDRSLKRQTRAELDIMVHGYKFMPTWICLPPDLPGEVPFDLNITLRIFSCEAFRSNDGWPRQPGAGFRSLLTLLNQLVHEGPSFGQHFEILAGKNTWAINKLSVAVTFPDPYSPKGWPAASHAIMRSLKSLALDGMADGIILTIHVHSEYWTDGPKPDDARRDVVWDRTYEVAGKAKDATTEKWREMGFLTAYQHTLAEDPRAPWDGSSGGTSLRGQRQISPLERRDSLAVAGGLVPDLLGK